MVTIPTLAGHILSGELLISYKGMVDFHLNDANLVIGYIPAANHKKGGRRAFFDI